MINGLFGGKNESDNGLSDNGLYRYHLLKLSLRSEGTTLRDLLPKTAVPWCHRVVQS